MGRPPGPKTRILSVEDRGGRGAKRHRVRYLIDGRESAECFATARKAREFVERFEREAARIGGKTVEVILNEWLDERRALGQPVYDYYDHQPKQVLRDVLDEPVSCITGPAMEAGFREMCGGWAGATAKKALAVLVIFGDWLVKKNLADVNPAKDIEFHGEVKKGKPQIETLRELYAFRDEVWRRARSGDRGSLGVLIGLYLGLRSGEVQALEARHVDVGRRLVVPGTKTRAAKRSVPVFVPELWALLEQAALIFRVQDAARVVGVANWKDLVFHSLRGMAASLATENGAAFEAIARGLGHTSYAVTGQHYATADSQLSASTRAAFDVLDGTMFPSHPGGDGPRERN
jgi:integrase